MKHVLVLLALAAPLQAEVMRQTSPNGITLSSATGTFVRKAGDTMTGALTISNGGLTVSGSTFTVAPTGIVSAPSQPVVISTRATDQKTVSGSWTTLYWGGDTKRENIGHDITNSSGTFTFAYAGTYAVSCSFPWSASNSGSRRIGYAFKGDIIWGPINNTPSTAAAEIQSFSTVVYADAGDTIACQGYQSSGTDLPFACSALSTQTCRMAVVKQLQ